jgi:hypothetical protein
LRRTVGRVCDFRGAVGGENLDDGVEADEGSPDAAWVEWGKVGDVVENAAEDEVVGAGVDGWRAEEQDSAGDVDVEVGTGLGDGGEEVVVVPRAVFTQAEAGNEESGGPGEEEADAVGVVL